MDLAIATRMGRNAADYSVSMPRGFDQAGPSRSNHNNQRLQGDPPRVLWIDDEISNSDWEVRFLQGEGICIDCAITGRAGLALARIGCYDVILLDLNLPDIPGLSVLATLRADRLKTSVLVVTGFGDFEAARVAGELGALGFEEKPVLVDDLKVSIQRMVTEVRSLTRAQNHADHHSSQASLRALAGLLETLHRLTQPSTVELSDDPTCRQTLTAVVIRALLDSTLPMPAFLACAAVLKSTVALRPAGAMFPLADKAYTVIMETLGRPKPTDFHVSTALTMLEEAAAQCKRLKGEEIARTRNLDPSHLSRLIKAETGFGFTDWRTAFLIRPSLAVLADTKEHVKQIACQLLGFKYQSQFDEEFERFFGLTPTAFRELAQAAASKLL